MIGFSCLEILMFTPIGSPIYVKGKDAGSQCKILARRLISNSSTQIPKTLLLRRLTHKPDARKKYLRILFKLLKLTSDHSPKHVTSSTYMRSIKHGPL